MVFDFEVYQSNIYYPDSIWKSKLYFSFKNEERY